MTNKTLLIGLLVLAVVAIGYAFYPQHQNLGGTGLLTQSSCTASTSVATISGAASSQILATSSRRAWARVENTNTSNSVALSFNYDKAVSTSAPNYQTLPTATANVANSIDFGLNTDFPYTGAVTASSSVGSVSLLVTQCNF